MNRIRVRNNVALDAEQQAEAAEPSLTVDLARRGNEIRITFVDGYLMVLQRVDAIFPCR